MGLNDGLVTSFCLGDDLPRTTSVSLAAVAADPIAGPDLGRSVRRIHPSAHISSSLLCSRSVQLLSVAPSPLPSIHSSPDPSHPHRPTVTHRLPSTPHIQPLSGRWVCRATGGWRACVRACPAYLPACLPACLPSLFSHPSSHSSVHHV